MLVRSILAAAFLAAAARGEAAPALEVTQIAPGNFVHYGQHEERSADNLGDNANIGFIVGSRCVLVIDAGGSRALGERLRAAVKRHTDKPVCYLVLTHVHPDHVFGAPAFLDEGPEVIGHANLPRQIAARGRNYLNSLRRDLGASADGSEIVPPSRILAAGQALELDLGGRTVDIKAWPEAHTDHDLTVFDRATETLWLGDLLFVEHTPVADSRITGFLDSMRVLRTVPAKHFVPGHGRPDAVWPAALDAQERYFTLVMRETRDALKRRRTLMEAVEEVGFSERGNWVNFETYHRRNVTTAYTELEWEE